MSYDGREEFICPNGHYWSHNANSISYGNLTDWDVCPVCGEHYKYFHNIDYTNGSYDDQPWTIPALKLDAGFQDKWQEDHYGNRYAVKIQLYKPAKIGKKNDSWHENPADSA